VLVSEKSTTIVHGTGESMQAGDIILAKVTRVEGFAVYIKARGHCGALGLSGEGDPPYLGGHLIGTPNGGNTLFGQMRFVNPRNGNFGARGLAQGIRTRA